MTGSLVYQQNTLNYSIWAVHGEILLLFIQRDLSLKVYHASKQDAFYGDQRNIPLDICYLVNLNI